MTTERILEAIAPCGLNCKKCFAHIDGEIRKHSLNLKEGLGKFEIYAQRFETLIGDPVFKKYPDFKAMIDYFATQHCRGCRHEQCKLFKGCGVRACHQEKGIDYCHVCDDFPCSRTGFDEHLYARWLKINKRIKAIGIKQFYEDTRDQPRYG